MSRRTQVFYVIFALVSALTPFVASSAEALSLVSNLSEPVRDFSMIGQGNIIGTTPTWAAQSFVTDNNTYSLVSILAKVGDGVNTPDVVAQLHDTNGSLVGNLLATLTAPDVTGVPSDLAFLPTSPVTLLPLTQYWFVLGASNAGTYHWLYAEGQNTTGLGSLTNYNYSDDNGATWQDFGTDNPFFLAVNVDSQAVPEPSTFILAATGLAGLGFLAGKKLRRA